jgi:Uma2 family endonuclease
MPTALSLPEDTRIVPPLPVYRFTVEEYHHLIEIGAFKPSDRIELIHGWLVPKVSHNPPHASVLRILLREITAALPADWFPRSQLPITMADSEPEPELAVVRGSDEHYLSAHPKPKDVALVAEVADSSLAQDRGVKLELYASVRIPVYWIINLIDGIVEVYNEPRGGKQPTYRSRHVYHPGDQVPLVLAGAQVALISVNTLLPFSDEA